jgi:hypothetical protein
VSRGEEGVDANENWSNQDVGWTNFLAAALGKKLQTWDVVEEVSTM